VAPELEPVIEALQGGRPDAEVEIDVMRGGETRRLRVRAASTWPRAWS
jgi:two-component system nitrogen regulation sensor histidine kinase NtrY